MGILPEYLTVVPFVGLAFWICAVLLLDLFEVEKRNALAYTIINILFCTTLGWWIGYCWGEVNDYAFGHLVAVDSFGKVALLLIILGVGLSLLLNSGQLGLQRVAETIDIDILVLLATFGAMVMVVANNLMLLFLGFETLSIAVYVLAGAAKTQRASTEGALKYFILGSFSSAFLLYGATLVYATTGSMNYDEISQAVSTLGVAQPLLLVGMAMILFGFAFKVGLVPFHFWTPDAYQGAPVSLTTFMAVVVKVAAFASFLRVMISAFGGLSPDWLGLMVVVSGLTMTVGNAIALRQRSVKRMLAYSSIAHAGYTMLGFVAYQQGGIEATLYYLFVYGIMTVLSFGVVLVVTAGSNAQYEADSIESYRGFGWRHPAYGFMMSVALLSLAGIPPLAGFFGKFYLFTAAINGGYYLLVILAALNSVVSLYYYLQILVVMYFSEGPSEVEFLPGDRGPVRVALAFATCAILLLGIFSQGFYGMAQDGAKSLVARKAEKRPEFVVVR